MNYNDLLNLIFPETALNRLEVEAKYPARNLPAGAMVTRIAPSPTGMMHVGTLYTALISERFAHQSGGVFFVRIEDTDKKREVVGAEKMVVDSLIKFGLKFDEGIDENGKDLGNYGPYRQSQRGDIYKAFIADLILQNKVYPCFCSSTDLENMRNSQDEQKIRTGYYGKFATCSHLTLEEQIEKIKSGLPFVLRFRSTAKHETKIKINDLVKGELELSSNDIDTIVLKADGLPTYHFAHVVDDKLMGTTHVLRGEEWLSSTPLHVQIFESLGWKAPEYGHIAPIQKTDNGNRRKLSKRKDPEATMDYYDVQGYPVTPVIEYLMNLANSNYEDWRIANPTLDYKEFKVTFDKLSTTAGALFDFVKLDSLCKEYVANLTVEARVEEIIKWATKHDPEFAKVLNSNLEYFKKIIGLEENSEKKRKDIAKWSQVKNDISYYFDEYYSLPADLVVQMAPVSKNDASLIATKVITLIPSIHSSEEWLVAMKELCVEMGYATSTKEYKAEPGKFKGYIGDVVNVVRLLITGRRFSPDMYKVIEVLGVERAVGRLGRIS